jgi:hypothetical protein
MIGRIPLLVRMKKAGRLVGVLLAVGALAEPAMAQAGCRHTPRPGVDWSGCSKARLMLRNEDLTGAVLTGALLTLSDFTGSNMVGAKLNETGLRAPFSPGLILPRQSDGGYISAKPFWSRRCFIRPT